MNEYWMKCVRSKAELQGLSRPCNLWTQAACVQISRNADQLTWEIWEVGREGQLWLLAWTTGSGRGRKLRCTSLSRLREREFRLASLSWCWNSIGWVEQREAWKSRGLDTDLTSPAWCRLWLASPPRRDFWMQDRDQSGRVDGMLKK